VLPPSTIVSPGSSRAEISSTARWVMSPAGTISQTIRGGSSFPTMSA
jgi:hypothetical protein